MRDALRASGDRPDAAASVAFPQDIPESPLTRKSRCLQPAAPASCRGEKSPETIGFVGEIDIDPLEGNALLGECDHRALHVGAELVADPSQSRGHGQISQLNADASIYMHLHASVKTTS